MREIWKDVVGYEGLYQVSNFGRVKRLTQKGPAAGKGFHGRKGHMLAQEDNGNGYLYVGLCKSGKAKHAAAHRLVAKAFIPNPDNLPEVNHKDENKANNRADNLEWCAHKDNINYGSRNFRTGLANGRAVLQFSLAGNFVKEWVSAVEAERTIGVTASCICGCCNNKIHSAGGYVWRRKSDFEEVPMHIKTNYRRGRILGRVAPKPVLQYSLDGQFIKEYPSMLVAARAISAIRGKALRATIAYACDGHLKTAYGYKWRTKAALSEAS